MPELPDLDYLHSTQLYRPARRRPLAPVASAWDTPVQHLLASGYAFLPAACGPDGVLFRGMQSGLAAALRQGSFGWFDGVDEVARVEQAMGVYFLSTEPGDAVTAARLYQQPADGGILAVRASWFHDCLQRGRAAVLAIGDGGLVFRYPLLTRPIPAAQVACVFVADTDAGPARHDPRIVPLGGATRAALEQSLQQQLTARGLTPATCTPDQRCPRLQP